MASIQDIVSVGQNIVTAINGLATAATSLAGNLTSATVTASTLVVTGQGRLVSVAVVAKGSGAGTINNAQTVAAAAASNVLLTVPDTAETVLQAGQMFNLGLVIIPGTGQSINVTYYQQ